MRVRHLPGQLVCGEPLRQLRVRGQRRDQRAEIRVHLIERRKGSRRLRGDRNRSFRAVTAGEMFPGGGFRRRDSQYHAPAPPSTMPIAAMSQKKRADEPASGWPVSGSPPGSGARTSGSSSKLELTTEYPMVAQAAHVARLPRGLCRAGLH